MADAVARADEAAFARVLADAPLIVPQAPAEGVSQSAGEPAWAPLTKWVAGAPSILVFTSVAGLGSSMLVGSYEETDYAQLRARWAGPTTWLLVNPGSPIEVRLSVSTIDRALRDESPLLPGWPPASQPADPTSTDQVEQILHDPEYEAGHEEYLDALCGSRAIVPVWRPVDHPEELLEPDFPWHVTGGPQTPTIEVFTAEETFAANHRDRWGVRAPFLMLMLAWPRGHALSVNPGGPVKMFWPADQVPLLQRRAIAD